VSKIRMEMMERRKAVEECVFGQINQAGKKVGASAIVIDMHWNEP